MLVVMLMFVVKMVVSCLQIKDDDGELGQASFETVARLHFLYSQHIICRSHVTVGDSFSALRMDAWIDDRDGPPGHVA